MAIAARLLCEGLSFSYPERALFDNISFRIEAPGFHSILGRSGTGKSTLAKILSGLLEGWNATNVVLPDHVLYCHENERLPPWQSVGRHIYSVTTESQIPLLHELIKKFALNKSILDLYPYQLSSGQNNRINVIRYLLQDFDLLILDEALSNVDEATRISILATIKALFSTQMFLYVSHHLLEVTAYSKTILFLGQSPNIAELKNLEGLDLPIYTSTDANRLTERLKKVMEYA